MFMETRNSTRDPFMQVSCLVVLTIHVQGTAIFIAAKSCQKPRCTSKATVFRYHPSLDSVYFVIIFKLLSRAAKFVSA